MRQAFSVAIFARHQNSILLIKHRRLGLWLPVGGELHPGESPQAAAVRELREETGLEGVFATDPQALAGQPPGLIGYEEHPAGNKGMHLNFNFLVDVASCRVAPNHEFEEHVWVDRADARACPENVTQLLTRILAGPSQAHRLAQAWLAAFNARCLEDILSLYADQAVHMTPRSHTPMVGKDAMRQWWQEAFTRLPNLRYRFQRTTQEGNRVYLEYLRETPVEPTQLISELFELDAAGKVCYSHVFIGGAGAS